MTGPDPRIVRQLATEHIFEDARRAYDVGADVLGHFGPDALTKHEYGAYCSAIREAIKTATLIVGWDASVTAGIEQEQELLRAGEFEITALHDCDLRETWIHIIHTPCQETVFGNPDDREDLDAGELLKRMTEHLCEPGTEPEGEPRDISQIIDVEVDGATVTAAFHGSRPLDAQEQEAMGEIVRAASRLQREREREERRQAEEDLRAIDRAVSAETGMPWDLIVAVRALGERFADRITAIRAKDAAAIEAGPAEGSDRP